jgi:pilus assembly protein Flp/PilA
MTTVVSLGSQKLLNADPNQVTLPISVDQEFWLQKTMGSGRYKAASIDTKSPVGRRAVLRQNRRRWRGRVALSSLNHEKLILLEINMLSIFRKLMKNERGATAIEYVLIASLISVAAIAAMTSVGGKVSNVLSNVASAMN